MRELTYLTKFFFSELIHRKIFMVVVVLGFVFIILSMLLGPLAYSEEKRLSINFSLAGSQISLIFLAILVGSSFLKNDIDSKSIHGMLARPINRFQYYLSKFLAFACCLFLLSILMWAVFIFTSSFVGFDSYLMSVVPFVGIFIEALLLFSLAMLLSLFSSSYIAIGATFSIFLIGHWVETLDGLVKDSTNAIFQGIGYVFMWSIPNLESLNWKSHLTYQDWLPATEYMGFIVYGLAWILFALFVGVVIFRSKDLA